MMLETLEPSNCTCLVRNQPDQPEHHPEEERQRDPDGCLWLNLHSHLREWYSEHTFRSVMMGQLTSDPLKTRAGTRQSQNVELIGEEGIINVAKDRCDKVCRYLYDGLADVYSACIFDT